MWAGVWAGEASGEWVVRVVVSGGRPVKQRGSDSAQRLASGSPAMPAMAEAHSGLR